MKFKGEFKEKDGCVLNGQIDASRREPNPFNVLSEFPIQKLKWGGRDFYRVEEKKSCLNPA